MANSKNDQRLSMRCLSIALALALHIVSQAAWAADVKGVRLWRAPDNTRVVLDMTGEAEHKLFQLHNPERIVIDIKNSKSQASVSNLDLRQTPIKRIRTAMRDKNDLRVVLDLSKDIQPRSFFLKRNAEKPDRLVIDLYDKNKTTTKTVAQAVEPQAATYSRRDIIIVVDAGHGGEDPGAISRSKGLKEKVVVLDIAKKLAQRINGTPGYKAILTRTGDYYLPLKKRRDIARKERADLFISVHADSFHRTAAKGASVFTLSATGATSETARFLARRENKADLIGGVGDVSLKDKDKILKEVLVDLSMTATIGASLDVGKYVLNDMGSFARLHKKHVEKAGFLVLKSPDVPSILVETGFISNPEEAKKLSSPRYRTKMAHAIFRGAKKYFERRPPAGSYVAWVKNGGGKIVHNVVSGDSLSTIAKRYSVSVNELKKRNKLSSSSIRVGQKIKVSTDEKTAHVHKPNKISFKPLSVKSDANNTKKITNNTTQPTKASTPTTHVVTSGDSLSYLSSLYNIKISELKRLNKLNKSALRIGQKLRLTDVSVDAGTPVKARAKTNIKNSTKNSAKNAVVATAVKQPRKTLPVLHKVNNGDTLSAIALKYNTSIVDILQLNDLSSSSLRIGQQLKIPKVDG